MFRPAGVAEAPAHDGATALCRLETNSKSRQLARPEDRLESCNKMFPETLVSEQVSRKPLGFLDDNRVRRPRNVTRSIVFASLP